MPRRGGTLEIAVRRRMLWVGSAAFPLHNLSRVEAFRLKPDRGAAFVRFLKWLAVVAAVYVAFNVMNGGDTSLAEDASPVLAMVVIVLIIVLIKELAEASKPILAVETAGGSLAIVTLPSMDQLREIAGQVVHAIDHPEAEFTAYVHQLNNYNGPVINQTGTGNTGIRR
ncbi:DUF6232 family protein [Streptomyces sp. NPDC051079]|uniref:DUF6232 family protein n=1 Tax=Streptomyces sp. NPDC051079 TaxID=3155043 RepID=UPI00344E8EA4